MYLIKALVFSSILKILDLLQRGLGKNCEKIFMQKTYYKYVICVSFIALGFFFSSCDQISTSIKEEFNSERPLPSQISKPTVAVQPAGSPSDSSVGFIYFVRGNKVSITPLKKIQNHYLLQMKTIGNPMISFGGIEETKANHLNNLIFFNQWSKGTSRVGALILLKNAPHSIPKDPCITVTIKQPHYDIDSDSASFVIEPQDDLRSEFLGDDMNSCVLLIKSE